MNQGQKPIILIGAGGHARSTLDVISSLPNLTVDGILDDGFSPGSEVAGLTVLGPIEMLNQFSTSHRFVIALGKIGPTNARAQLANLCWDVGGQLQTVVSPTAYVSPGSHIGEGTVVFHHAVVNTGAEVGKNCIINTSSLVEHDSTIGNHSHVSTGAIVNGGCQVGENVFLGSGSILHQQVVVPDDAVIAAGDVVRGPKR